MSFLDELTDLKQEFSAETLRPGAIFYLPVPFAFSSPALFLDRQDDSEPQTPSARSQVTRGDVWLDEETRRYRSIGVQEIIGRAKVRPFLVIRLVSFSYGKYILGLPISSVKPGMRQGPFYHNFRQNRYPHFFCLPSAWNAQTGLDIDSYVVISAPAILSVDYFSHYRGFVGKEHFNQIRGKLRKFI